jgi:hypothetical protein
MKGIPTIAAARTGSREKSGSGRMKWMSAGLAVAK